VHGGDQTLAYLERPPDERPFAIQVFGHDADVLAEGARIAVEKYGPVDALDINMGCPVKKVCSHGAGAALLKDPYVAERAVRKVVDAVAPLPVTVKLRAGWDEEHRNAPEIARACEQGGAVAIGLHPRTRAQMYRGRADWSLITATKSAVKISVWGSGDLFTAKDALRMLAETGADAARIARGACGYPWIFRELLALERGEDPPEVTVQEWRQTVLRHVDLAVQEKLGRFRLVRAEGAPRPRAFRPPGAGAEASPSGASRPTCTPPPTSARHSIASSPRTVRFRPKCATSPCKGRSPPKTEPHPERVRAAGCFRGGGRSRSNRGCFRASGRGSGYDG